MAYTIPGTDPTRAQRPPTLRTTATPSRSGPAPGRVTAPTGRLPGDVCVAGCVVMSCAKRLCEELYSPAGCHFVRVDRLQDACLREVSTPPCSHGHASARPREGPGGTTVLGQGSPSPGGRLFAGACVPRWRLPD